MSEAERTPERSATESGDPSSEELASHFSARLSLGKRPTSTCAGKMDDMFDEVDSNLGPQQTRDRRPNLGQESSDTATTDPFLFSPSLAGPKPKRTASAPTPEQMRELKASTVKVEEDDSNEDDLSTESSSDSDVEGPDSEVCLAEGLSSGGSGNIGGDSVRSMPSSSTRGGTRDAQILKGASEGRDGAGGGGGVPPVVACSQRGAQCNVGIMAPPVCVSHVTPAEHQESAHRLEVLCGDDDYRRAAVECGDHLLMSGAALNFDGRPGALRREAFHGNLTWLPCRNLAAPPQQQQQQQEQQQGEGEPNVAGKGASFNERTSKWRSGVAIVHEAGVPAAMADILRVHDWEYIEHVRRQCAKTTLHARAVAATLSGSSRDFEIKNNSAKDNDDAMFVADENADPTNGRSNGSTCDGKEKRKTQPKQRHNAAAVPLCMEVGVGAPPPGFLDGDTRLSAGSWIAATVAAGTAIAAVDTVMEDFLEERRAHQTTSGERSLPPPPPPQSSSSKSSKSPRKVFVATRPPGHHAGSRGCVPSSQHFWQKPEMCSCGFCLLNNVAIAAAYARYKFGAAGLRVAIVDFDIHHGNGTQEIVSNLVPRSVPLPLPPSWPAQHYRTFKPWYNGDTDPGAVFFGSINLVNGPMFYPGSGGGMDDHHTGDSQEEALLAGGPFTLDPLLEKSGAQRPTIVNVELGPVSKTAAPGDLRARKRQTQKDRAACCKAASAQFQERVAAQLIPRLEAFAPDLLLLSAGFDGHCDDFYHYLTDQDYAWLTEQMVAVMEPRGGRIVSVLEGGYSLLPLHPPPKPRTAAAAAAAGVGSGAAAHSGGAAPEGSTRSTRGSKKKNVSAENLAPGPPAATATTTTAAATAATTAQQAFAAAAEAGQLAAAASATSTKTKVKIGAANGTALSPAFDGGLAKGVMAHIRALGAF